MNGASALDVGGATIRRRTLARSLRGTLKGGEYTWAVAFVVPYIAVFLAFVAAAGEVRADERVRRGAAFRVGFHLGVAGAGVGPDRHPDAGVRQERNRRGHAHHHRHPLARTLLGRAGSELQPREVRGTQERPRLHGVARPQPAEHWS